MRYFMKFVVVCLLFVLLSTNIYLNDNRSKYDLLANEVSIFDDNADDNVECFRTYMVDNSRSGNIGNSLILDNIKKYLIDWKKPNKGVRFSHNYTECNTEEFSPFKNITAIKLKNDKDRITLYDKDKSVTYDEDLARTQPLCYGNKIIMLVDDEEVQDTIICIDKTKIQSKDVQDIDLEVSGDDKFLLWKINKDSLNEESSGVDEFFSGYSQPYIYQGKYIIPCIIKYQESEYTKHVLVIDIEDPSIIKNYTLNNSEKTGEWKCLVAPTVYENNLDFDDNNDRDAYLYLGDGDAFYSIELDFGENKSDEEINIDVDKLGIEGNGINVIDEDNNKIYIVKNIEDNTGTTEDEREGSIYYYNILSDGSLKKDITSDGSIKKDNSLPLTINKAGDKEANKSPKEVQHLTFHSNYLIFIDVMSKDNSNIRYYNIKDCYNEKPKIAAGNIFKYPTIIDKDISYTPSYKAGYKYDICAINDLSEGSTTKPNDVFGKDFAGGIGLTSNDLIIMPAFREKYTVKTENAPPTHTPTLQFIYELDTNNTITYDIYIEDVSDKNADDKKKNFQRFRTGFTITDDSLFCQDLHGTLVYLKSKSFKIDEKINWKTSNGTEYDRENPIKASSIKVNSIIEKDESSYSVAIDTKGNPHIAWSDHIDDNREIYYAYLTEMDKEKVWVCANGESLYNNSELNINANVSNIPNYISKNPHLKLDNDNNPHIVWENYVEYNDIFVNRLDIFYAEWNGNDWVAADNSEQSNKELSDSPFNISKYDKNSINPSLSLEENGSPHIVWENNYSENDNIHSDIFYLRYDNTWKCINEDEYKLNDKNNKYPESANVSNCNVSSSPYLALEADDKNNLVIPHITWVNNEHRNGFSKIYYVKWHTSTDPEETFWICASGEKYSVSKFPTGNILSNAEISNDSNVLVSQPFIILDSSNQPHIKWNVDENCDKLNDSIAYIKREDSKWKCANGTDYVKTDSNKIGDVYVYSSLNQSNNLAIKSSYFNLDRNNNPHFIWNEYKIDDIEKSNILYTRWNGNKWICSNGFEILGSNGSDYELAKADANLSKSTQSSTKPIIQTDPNGRIHVCWLESNYNTNGNIIYLKGTMGNILKVKYSIPLTFELFETTGTFGVGDEKEEVKYTEFKVSSSLDNVRIMKIGGEGMPLIPYAVINIDLEDSGIGNNMNVTDIDIKNTQKTNVLYLSKGYEKIPLGFDECLSDDINCDDNPLPGILPYNDIDNPKIVPSFYVQDVKTNRKAIVYIPLIEAISKDNDDWYLEHLAKKIELTIVFEKPKTLKIERFQSATNNEQYDLLIIGDKRLSAKSEKYAKWKSDTCKIKTFFVPLDSNKKYSQEEIKSIIEYYYNNHGCTYVFLVGDDRSIPCKKENDTPSDHYYSYLGDNDRISKIRVGRLPLNLDDIKKANNNLKLYTSNVKNYFEEKCARNDYLFSVMNDTTSKYYEHYRYLIQEIKKYPRNESPQSFKFSKVPNKDKEYVSEKDLLESSFKECRPLFVDMLERPDPANFVTGNVSGIGNKKAEFFGSSCFPWFLYSTASKALNFMVNLKSNFSKNILTTDNTKCLAFIGYTNGISDQGKDTSSYYSHVEFIKTLTDPPSGADEQDVGNIFLLSKNYFYGNTTNSYDANRYNLNLLGDPSIIIKYASKNTRDQNIIINMEIGSKNCKVNDEIIKMDVAPELINGTTFLPAKYVVEEALGGNVDWDSEEEKVTCTHGCNTIEFWIGKSTARLNGVEVQIDENNPDVVPTIINDRTLVPMRFLAENLGCEVEWVSETRVINITYPKEG
jgi:Copper amine oxidase N-terminal domain